MSENHDNQALDRLVAFVERLRPADGEDGTLAAANLRGELARLDEAAAAQLADDLLAVLAEPGQAAFFAETGVRTAQGFWIELRQRIGNRLLPPLGEGLTVDVRFGRIFNEESDADWVAAVPEDDWRALAERLPARELPQALRESLLEALRMLSYRLAGAALDRELLRAEPSLERYASPFMAQNTVLVPMLDALRAGDAEAVGAHAQDIEVLLAQCGEALERVRRRAGEQGISIRLTHLLARLRQLVERQRQILAVLLGPDRPAAALVLWRALLRGRAQRAVLPFVGENVSLLARNVTDHASRHGEHYIAEDRAGWLAMARSAAGGGIIIALMALIKLRLSLLHLPPLTEGVLFGLNYGLGFVAIHLLGLTVATKQPAMTAAAIAATLEEARPRELGRLADLAQAVIRTQFVAVLGNVGLAFPVACLIAWSWFQLAGNAPAPEPKLLGLLGSVHPWRSGALFFAAVAGVGLFLSGLVSGYFDNQARYHQLPARLARSPWLARLGDARAVRLTAYLDAHYGAILGNLFFGMYLGLMGALGGLTGLPVDIAHVAFSSANLGTVVTALPAGQLGAALWWGVAGVAGIALVNLLVSFSLALYVAMKSRRQGAVQLLRLGGLLVERFRHQPLGFLLPPRVPAAPPS